MQHLIGTTSPWQYAVATRRQCACGAALRLCTLCSMWQPHTRRPTQSDPHAIDTWLQACAQLLHHHDRATREILAWHDSTGKLAPYSLAAPPTAAAHHAYAAAAATHCAIACSTGCCKKHADSYMQMPYWQARLRRTPDHVALCSRRAYQPPSHHDSRPLHDASRPLQLVHWGASMTAQTEKQLRPHRRCPVGQLTSKVYIARPQGGVRGHPAAPQTAAKRLSTGAHTRVWTHHKRLCTETRGCHRSPGGTGSAAGTEASGYMIDMKHLRSGGLRCNFTGHTDTPHTRSSHTCPHPTSTPQLPRPPAPQLSCLSPLTLQQHSRVPAGWLQPARPW